MAHSKKVALKKVAVIGGGYAGGRVPLDRNPQIKAAFPWLDTMNRLLNWRSACRRAVRPLSLLLAAAATATATAAVTAATAATAGHHFGKAQQQPYHHSLYTH
jgi:hypothetical protein